MSSESKITNPDEIWKNLNKVSTNLDEVSVNLSHVSANLSQVFENLSKTELMMQKNAEESKADFADLRATQKKTELMVQKIGGRFNQRWGALVESLVEGKLVKIFKSQNIDISQTYTRAISEKKQANGKVKKREIDILVANGTEVVATEVKTSLTKKDVEYFLNVLSDFKTFFPKYKNETLYGAMAFLKAENKSDTFAEEKGLFIICATGDSARLVNQADFKAKAFA